MLDILNFLKDYTFWIIPTIVAYILGRRHSLLDKKRELTLQYLIDAYRRAALAVQRKPEKDSPYFRDLESLVADVQLFGTVTQNTILIGILDEWKKHNKGNFNGLLADLRNHLRKELKLESINEPVRWFRPEGGCDISEKEHNL